MFKKLAIPTLAILTIALTMVLAPTMMSAVNTHQALAQQEVKPTDKNKCQTKIQVTATGVTNGTEYTTTILDKSITKTAGDQASLSFTFNFAKKQKAIEEVKPAPTIPGICPAKGSELQGDINGQIFDITIADSKGGKPTKVTVDVSTLVPPPTDGNTTNTAI